MSQQELESAIARATGESRKTIRRRGFSILDVGEVDFDPEPNDTPPLLIDWDQHEARRRAA